MSDRATQDRVIRALADAPYRRSTEWSIAPLADTERVELFARFLARNYYHLRLIHFFKYSRALSEFLGRRPEEIVRSQRFAQLSPTVVLGSKQTAREVAQIAREHVLSSQNAGEIPYLRDLLRYEETMMATEAGPRRSSQGSDRPIVESTRIQFAFDLPSIFPMLTNPPVRVPEAQSRQTTLLFTRDNRGRVTVLQES